MKGRRSRVLKTLAKVLGVLSVVIGIPAQGSTPGQVWGFTLVDGSQLIDDCQVCDRLPIIAPMRGTFKLRFLQQGPLFSNYALEEIAFTASAQGRAYKVTGEGSYRIGGELAVFQDLFLKVWIDNGITADLCLFSNGVHGVTRAWPMLQVSADQTNGTLTRQYHLDINAAPFRELWFSTVKGFAAGIWNPPTNSASGGDLLSTAGRAVKRNQELSASFVIQPPVADAGLKDIDVLPGGEIVFSVEQDLFSERLGRLLRSGDLLSDAGRVLRTNEQLLAAFAPQPPSAGLAAVQVMDDGQIYFSVQTNFASKKLGRTIQPGDLLSDKGTIVKTGGQLLALFKPATTNDYGLNAFFIWPNGETWFSTRDGFYDVKTNYYAPGDLLSDQGYVVYRNAQLVADFMPIVTSQDFGLDALYVISDLTSENSAAMLGTPQVTNQPPASLALPRKGGGRVFQLERANQVAGPYLPVGPITTAATLIDPGTVTNLATGFYRLHQW